MKVVALKQCFIDGMLYEAGDVFDTKLPPNGKAFKAYREEEITTPEPDPPVPDTFSAIMEVGRVDGPPVRTVEKNNRWTRKATATRKVAK